MKTYHRRSIRLPDYDYSQPGGYFITLVTYQRESLFGVVNDREMLVNPLGLIVAEEWHKTAQIRPEMTLNEMVIMPNHVHCILFIRDVPVGAHGGAPIVGPQIPGAHGGAPLPARRSRSIGSFVAGFKSVTAKRINEVRNSPGVAVWQRNYYEHVLRDEVELSRARAYIINNPGQWDDDEDNPNRPGRQINP